MTTVCPDCKRKLSRPRISAGMSEEQKAAREATARLCLWCQDLNLLGGGFEPAGLDRRWQGQDLKLIREQGAALMAERLKPKARRRAEKKTAEAQGRLAA